MPWTPSFGLGHAQISYLEYLSPPFEADRVGMRLGSPGFGTAECPLPSRRRRANASLPRERSAIPHSASEIGKVRAKSTGMLLMIGCGEQSNSPPLAGWTTTSLPYSKCNLMGVGVSRWVRVCDLRSCRCLIST